MLAVRTLVFLKELRSEKSFTTLLTPEAEVGIVASFVFDQVRPAGECFMADGTLEGFDAAVCDDVSFEFVWTIEFLGAAWNMRETKIVNRIKSTKWRDSINI